MSRLLAVEDSRTQALELRAILEDAGLEVELAPDAERGLDLFHASPFDLVVSDIVLPGMSGYDLCRRVKADPDRGGVPVILLTALSDPMDIVRGLECGADNFLTKPYDPDYLLGRVRRMLDQGPGRRGARLRVGA